jgi:tRNA threonylcarbamoyladenosine biosynthesis protein TsaB
MTYILHIDTATETAQVALGLNGSVLGSAVNTAQKDHAAFLQPAVAALLKQAGIAPGQLAAVAVTDGPGSYTGLRVGMASAKGLCYALQKPLITVGSLALMAASAKAMDSGLPQGTLYCPMIDARRMEVFTALYSEKMEELAAPAALVLDADSFAEALARGPVCFFGSGAAKFRPLCPQGIFLENFNISMPVFCQLSFQLFENQHFSDVAYSEPAYVKAFYTTQKRQEQ